MKPIILTACLLSLSACVATASPQTQSEAPAFTVSVADFQPITGDNWTGHLSYLDYSSTTEERIPVSLEVYPAKGRTVKYAITYPGEGQYNSVERMRLSRDGQRLNGHQIIEKTNAPDGTLSVTTLHTGSDDNRPAEIKMIYVTSENILKITKQVRFQEEDAFFQRNEYALTR